MRILQHRLLRSIPSTSHYSPPRDSYNFLGIRTSSYSVMTTIEPHGTKIAAEKNEPKGPFGKDEEWGSLAPYKVHEKTNFTVLYDASCHCGRVTYQLSRQKPLDAKYCHCKTCQRLHGEYQDFSVVGTSPL